jgi:hypothetical protein
MKQHLIINNQLNYELLAQYAYDNAYKGEKDEFWAWLSVEERSKWIAAIKHICDEQLGIKIVPNE